MQFSSVSREMVDKRGLSLVEAIISMFVLFCAFLVIIALFHSGLRYTNRIEQQQIAVLLAQRKVEEVRAWAQTPTGGGYKFDDWTPYNGVNATAPDHPGYVLRTEVLDRDLYSGCSTLELPYPSSPPGERRVLTESLKLLTVQVSWDNGQQRLQVASGVGNPPRRFRAATPVVITVGPYTVPLAHLASVNMSVQAFDSFNTPLRDVTFLWAITACNASATLTQNRDGTTANLTNVVRFPGSPDLFTGGNVIVQAVARLHGVNSTALSAPIELQP